MIFHLLLHFSMEVSPHLREWSCKSWPMVWQLSGRFSIGYPVIPMCLRIRISLVYPKNAGSTIARKIWKIDHFQVIKCRSTLYKYRSATFSSYRLPSTRNIDLPFSQSLEPKSHEICGLRQAWVQSTETLTLEGQVVLLGIYIYINTYVSISISISLSLYIYSYIFTLYIEFSPFHRRRTRFPSPWRMRIPSSSATIASCRTDTRPGRIGSASWGFP
jgi:hypothetical protein